MLEGFLSHVLAHFALNLGKIRDVAIVHDGMDTEHEWMVVRLGNCC